MLRVPVDEAGRDDGGRHHSYFPPAKGASDKALALFSFPSLAAYGQYRRLFSNDPDFVAADRIRDDSGCVLRYQRTFMRPLIPVASTRRVTRLARPAGLTMP